MTVSPEQVAALRRELGLKLAQRRRAAELSQVALAQRTGYERSTVATAESGHRFAAEGFWRRCDDVLAARGLLVAEFHVIQAKQRQLAEQRRSLKEHQREARLSRWREEQAPQPQSGSPWADDPVIHPASHSSTRPMRDAEGEGRLASAWRPPEEASRSAHAKLDFRDAQVAGNIVTDVLDAKHDADGGRHALADPGQAEATILMLCRQVLLESLSFSAEATQGRVLDNIVRIGERTLVLKIRPDLHFDQILRIVLQDLHSVALDASPEYAHAELAIENSVGRYHRIRVTVPADLEEDLSTRILPQVAAVLSAGYRWLHRHAVGALADLGGNLERSSLRLLRHSLAKHEVLDLSPRLWLVKVVDGRVSYAVDDEVVATALRLGRQFHTLQQPAASIANALFANSIPFSRSFSREALGGQRTVSMSLTHTPYGSLNTDFVVAQTVIYDRAMLLSPLAGDRRGWLLAAYPAAIKARLEPALAAAKRDLLSHFASTPTSMRKPLVPEEGGGVVDNAGT